MERTRVEPTPDQPQRPAPVAPDPSLTGRVLALQRMAGNQAVSRLLSDLGHARPSTAPSRSIQRTIDPDYATWRGPNPDSRQLISQFYRRYVQPEYARVRQAAVDPALIQTMSADMQTMTQEAQQNPFNVPTAVVALNALVLSINAVSDAMSDNVGPSNPYENPEQKARRERTRRTGAITTIGGVKPGTVRGLRSAAEGAQLLNDLHAAVTRGLNGSGLTLGQVGVRGSSVTGIRSRNQGQFEWGTGQYQNMSDASDHDFFFTCTGLDPLINRHGGERSSLNSNGTMMGIYLLRLLGTLAEVKTGSKRPTPSYPWATTLANELKGFTTAAESLTGRKSDVTYISPTGGTGATLATDPGTVIR